MRAAAGALLMAGLLALYLWATAYQAWVMIVSGQPVAVAMGIALFILPVVGVWALVRELMFGFRSASLGKQLASEGPLPFTDVEHTASGRVDRAVADAVFSAYADAVDAEPDSWRAWFKLGIAYDAAGDRKRARASIRHAIALAKVNPA